MQNQSGSLGKGCGSVMPNGSGNVALDPSFPWASVQGTRLAPLCADPPVAVCQGFVKRPQLPSLPPFFPPSPMCFYSFRKQRVPNPTSQLALLHVFVFYACAALASSACAEVEAAGGEGARVVGEGNGSRLLLSKPLFV